MAELEQDTHPSFRFSGRVHPHSRLHQLKEEALADHVIPPTWVHIPGVGNIPQYADTVYGTSTEYDPAGDCNGYFMSSKFQPNNNCYAYGCVIASNSFPQPGRKNGYTLPSPFTGADVVHGAELDGLHNVGTEIDDVQAHADGVDTAPGHYVALLISKADKKNNWPGDYHWVRCDDLGAGTWSQKDGSDQVTNFDFAGHPITDPATANWTVNQGPTGSGQSDLIVHYDFYTYMFVPSSGVDII
jgi:hypothetical protein